MHQLVDEQKSSSSLIGKYFRDKHCFLSNDLKNESYENKRNNFYDMHAKRWPGVLKFSPTNSFCPQEVQNKFVCLLLNEMLLRELRPSLSFLSDSIRSHNRLWLLTQFNSCEAFYLIYVVIFFIFVRVFLLSIVKNIFYIFKLLFFYLFYISYCIYIYIHIYMLFFSFGP